MKKRKKDKEGGKEEKYAWEIRGLFVYQSQILGLRKKMDKWVDDREMKTGR